MYDDKEIPGERVYDSAFLKKALPRNWSTVSLDTYTLDTINKFVEGQKEFGAGGMPMVVPRATNKVINPSRTVTLSELRRHHKQFLL